MPLVAPLCVRYTINGTNNGVNVANILDFNVVPNDVTDMSRSHACEVVAKDLVDHWFDDVATLLCSSYTFTGVSWVDLDSETGSVGSVSAGNTVTLPQSGSDDADPYSGQVAVLVQKISVNLRGARKGRFYVPGLSEDRVSGNHLNSGFVSGLNGAFSDFLEHMTSTGTLDTTLYYPVVIHTRTHRDTIPPTIVYVSNTQINSFSVEGTTATQRRRIHRA